MASELWQNLMDRSYAKWENTVPYRRFLLSLDSVERKAVILGNFNYQVLNGGLQQWVDNGYASGSGRDLLAILEEIGTEVSEKILKIVKQTLQYVNTDMEKFGFGEDYWNEPWDGEEPPACYETVDKLTDEFYKISDDFEHDVGKYLEVLSCR